MDDESARRSNDARAADDDVEWLDRAAFWQRWHERLQPDAVALDHDLVSAITEPELRAAIPVAPTVSPPGDDDPGPILVWYVAVADRLAIVKHYVHDQDPRITVISTHAPSGECAWEAVRELARLPWLIESLVHVERDLDAALVAVVTENDYGVPVEVYRSEHVDDAEALVAFLNASNARFDYALADAERLGRHWIVIRSSDEARLAARCRSRVSAEMIARSLSVEESGVTYCVEAEDDGELAALYTHGLRNAVTAPGSDATH